MMPLMHSGRRLVLAVVLCVGVSKAGAAGAAVRYVCPPCGVPCDTLTFDEPGVCPKCGMRLVDAASAAAHPAPDRTRVAILVFDGVEIIDAMGPYELFGAAGYDVYTVGATKQPVTSAMGQILVPRYDFATAPRPDVLMVPGGGVQGAMSDSRLMAYVASTEAEAKHTMSVCNGAFILAKSGLLDGLTATTTYGNVVRLQNEFPRVKVVNDRRYVDNGRIITTAGLTAGMDGALHLIAVMDGEAKAREVALGEEYEWHPEGGYVRPSLADRMLPHIRLSELESNAQPWDVVRSQGDAEHWEVVVQGGSNLSAKDLLDAIGTQLVSDAHWAPTGRGKTSHASDWSLPGVGPDQWRGHLEVAAVPTQTGRFTVSLVVARVH